VSLAIRLTLKSDLFFVGMVCQMDLQLAAWKLPNDDAGTMMRLLWQRQVIAHPISNSKFQNVNSVHTYTYGENVIKKLALNTL